MNVPNALTLLRIFFVPLVVAALVQDDWDFQVLGIGVSNDMLGVAVFLAAAITDLLDGYLARRWKQITTVGTLLDPIADKLLISSALIALVQMRIVPAWMVVLIVGREFAVSGLRSIAAAEGYIIRANDFGKVKLVTQVVAITLAMLSVDHPELYYPMMFCMWGVVFFALLSAGVYFRKFWRTIDIQVKRRRRRELIVMQRERRVRARAAQKA